MLHYNMGVNTYVWISWMDLIVCEDGFQLQSDGKTCAGMYKYI